MMVAELSGFVLTFAPLIVAPFLPGKIAAMICLPAFFLIAILVIVIVCANFNRVAEYEWRTTEQKIRESGFAVLEDVRRHDVEAACVREKLREIEGKYYLKKMFVGKYGELRPLYVKCVECSCAGDAVDVEVMRFEEMVKPKPPVCLLLFMFCKNASERDFECLMEASKNLILAEKMAICYPGVLVLVEEETGKGYYVPALKRGASFHAKGVRLMKKLVARSGDSE